MIEAPEGMTLTYNICEIWVRDGDLGDGNNPYATLAYDVAGQFFISSIESRIAKVWKPGEVDVITRYDAHPRYAGAHTQ
ncbi:hypothetical protein SEA_APHELION_66 [Gordonia phage Aphelion]|uniref:Uncharacterized protein n=1 Tax=Gordonia phage Aphelion TaxID=2507860 RepID=A0A410TD33_9CAUD|nr:hypothetical protein BIZ74_gp137 [Gordonia phage Cucurbita]AUE23636.1 hypothetical protein SEA_TONIANN_67 [Gordonia phage Toniann]QAU06931.1 hypothetical protein SEA_APHELION_66 [Gordonia phage Aphelion]QYC53551.1 hypothetical protein SEA_NORVS_67 [Gordonia phage Norvs]WKW85865.1 hypothetical protein SEA_PHINKBODEN_66 [Gordonia Phage PhinkBoden]AOE44160.1 hypothetical protein SEA_CUCURBITA_68 [Gordonia phage Cucurbita]